LGESVAIIVMFIGYCFNGHVQKAHQWSSYLFGDAPPLVTILQNFEKKE